MSISRWRDPRYDFDGQERMRRRRHEADEARRIAQLVRDCPEALDALLAALAPGIVEIIRAIRREDRR